VDKLWLKLQYIDNDDKQDDVWVMHVCLCGSAMKQSVMKTIKLMRCTGLFHLLASFHLQWAQLK